MITISSAAYYTPHHQLTGWTLKSHLSSYQDTPVLPKGTTDTQIQLTRLNSMMSMARCQVMSTNWVVWLQPLLIVQLPNATLLWDEAIPSIVGQGVSEGWISEHCIKPIAGQVELSLFHIDAQEGTIHIGMMCLPKALRSNIKTLPCIVKFSLALEVTNAVMKETAYDACSSLSKLSKIFLIGLVGTVICHVLWNLRTQDKTLDMSWTSPQNAPNPELWVKKTPSSVLYIFNVLTFVIAWTVQKCTKKW